MRARLVIGSMALALAVVIPGCSDDPPELAPGDVVFDDRIAPEGTTRVGDPLPVISDAGSFSRWRVLLRIEGDAGEVFLDAIEQAEDLGFEMHSLRRATCRYPFVEPDCAAVGTNGTSTVVIWLRPGDSGQPSLPFYLAISERPGRAMGEAESAVEFADRLPELPPEEPYRALSGSLLDLASPTIVLRDGDELIARANTSESAGCRGNTEILIKVDGSLRDAVDDYFAMMRDGAFSGQLSAVEGFAREGLFVDGLVLGGGPNMSMAASGHTLSIMTC